MKRTKRCFTSCLAILICLCFMLSACGKSESDELKQNDDTKPDEVISQDKDPDAQDDPQQTEEDPQQTEDDPQQTEDDPQQIENDPQQTEDESQQTGGDITSDPVTPPALIISDIAGEYEKSPATLTETPDMGEAYIDDIIFLGDSTTYGLRYYSMLKGGQDTLQVWTPTSGTLTLSNQSFATILYPDNDTEITIREAVALKKPKMMVITLGVNGVSFMDEEYFKSEYTALVNGIKENSPDTKIILQSIYPVAAHYEYLSSINNDKIAAANQWIIDIAEDTGVRYLATSSALIGEDGFLPYDYQNGDGLHLQPTAFTIVLNYIRTHGYA